MKNVNVILRTLVLGGLLAVAGWWTLFLRGKALEHEKELEERDQRIEQLSGDVRERDARIEQLDSAMMLLKLDHRIARIEVLEQSPDAEDPARVRTRLRFTELTADGVPLGPGRELTIGGRIAYVDALVIKFGDEYVEQGDALRGTSVCIFRRLFGEFQEPSQGFPLDTAGTRPLAYPAEEPASELHQRLWERFWDYANDPEAAASLGVRAMQGEAPFIELRPGRSYRVQLRASDGLTIVTE